MYIFMHSSELRNCLIWRTRQFLNTFLNRRGMVLQAVYNMQCITKSGEYVNKKRKTQFLCISTYLVQSCVLLSYLFEKLDRSLDIFEIVMELLLNCRVCLYKKQGIDYK